MKSLFEKNKWILSLLLITLSGFLLGYLFNGFRTPEIMYKDQGIIQGKFMEKHADPEHCKYILLVSCISGFNLKVYTSEKIYSKYNRGDNFSFHCPWKYAQL